MPTHLNADLHCHSVISDGTLSPEDLARRARDNGVELWAMTDHDVLDGQARAMAAARDCGLRYLCGIEISVSFEDLTVHVVGLGLNPDNPTLKAALAALRSGREARAREISESLAKVGIRGAYEAALRHAGGNADQISRTHFARYLVDRGLCADMGEVFKNYLVRGKPGYAPYRWAALKDAVRWINDAQGLAVLAHPGRYNASPLTEFALFDKFKKAGGQGVEVVTGHHGRADEVKYGQMAQHFGLMGSLPELPPGLPRVWDALSERVIGR